MRALIAQHFLLALTALLLGCSDSPTDISGSTRPTVPGPDKPVLRLTLTPNNATIQAGSAIRLTATNGLDVVLPPSEVTWTSSSPEIASVGVDGIVRGHRTGQVLVGAHWNAVHAAAQVAVIKADSGEAPQ
jgi:uncharacterized protein YjdB